MSLEAVCSMSYPVVAALLALLNNDDAEAVLKKRGKAVKINEKSTHSYFPADKAEITKR